MSIGRLRSEIAVGYREECLLEITPKLNVQEEKKRLLVTADCGSTQTRVSIIDLDAGDFESGLTDIFVVPSKYGVITEFVPTDWIKSGALYDNLQSKIANASWKEGDIVNYTMVARTTIMEDLGLVPSRMSSAKEKSEDANLYVNLVDAIGFAMLRKFGGRVPRVNEIYLSLALPPEDLTANNKERLKGNLKTYRWSNCDSDDVTLRFADVFFTPEAEAFIQGYYALTGVELPEVSLHIEGGGRSISPALCRSGRAVNTARVSLPYGGTALRKIIADEFYQDEQMHLSERQLDSVVETGKCKIGKVEHDLVCYVDSAKQKMAKKIVSDLITKVFEGLDGIRLTDLEEVTASGRLFAPGSYDSTLMKFVAAEFRKYAPAAEFMVIEEPYINKGLVLIGLQNLQG